jgi:hypothetical protein
LSNAPPRVASIRPPPAQNDRLDDNPDTSC